MNRKYLIILALLLLTFIVLLIIFKSQKSLDQLVCEEGGGIWSKSGSGYIDTCSSIRLTTGSFEIPGMGCHCNENMCWNGTGCELI